ncbi:unnamed protein product, partial [Didymodactylos carnosus]
MAYSVSFVFLFLLFSSTTHSFNNDISIVRQRVLETMIWPTQLNITSTIQNALSYARTLNSSCYWSDINYADQNVAVWSVADHMARITTMLEALTVPGSTVQNNATLMSSVHCALDVWLINDWQNPNWWFNQINIPIYATSQLLMLGDNATSFEIEKIKEISYRAAWWLHRPQDTGANLVWMIQAQLYRSLATANITGLEQGFRYVWNDIVVVPVRADGVQNDWSYHFHGHQLLTGSYGQTWMNNIFSFLVCSVKTQFEPDANQLLLFSQFLTKGVAWMTIETNWDWHVVGRVIARSTKEYQSQLNPSSMRVLANLIESNELKKELVNFADRLDSRSNAALLIGNKHFYTSDYQVHHRVNWTSAIKMQSIRTQPLECINGENLKAEHTGQGVLNLYTVNNYAYNDIFPLLDWQAINGITVEHSIPLEPCKDRAMMDTASHNLTAKRSWHFYDDAIITLATNLTLTTPTTAWTTLASRLLPTGQITIGFFNSTVITLSDGIYSFRYIQNKTSNVQWIHVGGSDIGYLLQVQKQYDTLGIEIQNKTNNYNTIGAYNYSVTARMLTIWINHGVGPYTLDYGYIILPNVSLQSMPSVIKQYDQEQIFSCISTNRLFHGTMWPSLKRASFVLWDNITTTFS